MNLWSGLALFALLTIAFLALQKRRGAED